MVGVNSSNYNAIQNGINFKSNSTTNPQNSGLNNFRNSSFSNINSQGDTFVSSTRPKQEKPNKKALLGLGAAAVVGIGAAACILSRGKVKSSSIKQLAENIEFKEAKTYEDAVKFAKEHLGVELELENNLAAANYINECLTTISNKMKGKSVLPQKVKFDMNLIGADGIKGAAGWCEDEKNLLLGPVSKDLYNIAQNKGCSLMDIFKESEQTNPKLVEQVHKTIFHEIGHANHYYNCKNASKMGRLGELKARGVKDTHFTEEFLNDVKNNDVVKKFHCDYALTSPAEFVADTFGYKMMGKSIPKEVEELYIKYGGPVIPA